MIPEEKDIREALKGYSPNHRFSRTEISDSLRYWFRYWKKEQMKKYNRIPIQLTNRQWIAVWNAIQIGTAVDDRDKVNVEDMKVLDKVKTKLIDNECLPWCSW